MTIQGPVRSGSWCRDHRGGRYSFDEFVARVEAFHGYAAPGLVLGGAMVSLALDEISDGDLFDAVCETPACLPDAVQLLTPCTAGNGWLRVHELGRFAVTLFDKETGRGARVAVSAEPLESWPALKAFFFKLTAKTEQDRTRLFTEIRDAGTAVCSLQRVTVKAEIRRKEHLGPVGVCPECGEGYPLRDGTMCRACAGFGYFDAEGGPVR